MKTKILLLVAFYLAINWISFPLSAQTNNATILRGEYYIDADPGIGKGLALPVPTGLSASNLFQLDFSIDITNNSPAGLHTLYIRFLSSSNVWSINRVLPFRIKDILPIVRAEYFMDTDPGEGKATRLDFAHGNNPLEMLVDDAIDIPTNMSKKVHTLWMRAKDSAERWSSPTRVSFAVQPTISISDVQYYVGNDLTNAVWSPMTPSGGSFESFGTNDIPVSGDIIATNIARGTQTVWVRAINNYGGTVLHPKFQFEVVNWPPVLKVVGDRMVRVGTPISYQVLASNLDGTNQVLKYSLGAGAPAGAAIDPQTGLFTWTPAGNASTNIIKIQVTDGASPNSKDMVPFTVFVEPASGGAGPSVVSAAGVGDSGRIGVLFDKPLDAASANNRDNYLVNGLKPESAELQADGRTVVLMVSGLVDVSFPLHVSGLKDALLRDMAGASDTTNSILTLRGIDLGLDTDPIEPGSEIAVSPANILMTAGGSGFSGLADHGRFLYEHVDGDFDVCVQIGRLAPTDFLASAGLMARTALDTGARAAGLFLRPVGMNPLQTNDMGYSVAPLARTIDNGHASVYGTVATNMPDGNAWMRLRRREDVFESYYGTDGRVWASMGKTNLVSTNGFYVGLAASAYTNQKGIITMARFLNYGGVTPWIFNSPQTQAVAKGSTVVFGVEARGMEPLKYQWLFNNTAIAGATNRLLSITNIAEANAGAYAVKVSNGVGEVTSDAAGLTLQDLAQGGFEGDVTPRPGGDNAVTISDWVEVGRMVVGLDQPTTVSEFKRADCAPRTSFGDGVLSSADWVQAGRYAMGLNDQTAAGGPEQRTIKPQSMTTQRVQSDRWVGLESVSGQSGSIVEVPVSMNALGGENGFGMSVVFDPGLLEYIGFTSTVEGAILQGNTTRIGNGRLGLALVMQPGQAMPAGVRELARLRFRVLVEGEALLSVGDQPVRSEVVSAEAEVMAALFLGGSVNRVAVKAVRLLEQQAGGGVVVTGAPSADGEYEVAGSSDLQTWEYLGRVTASGGRLEFNDPAGDGAVKRFYRLYLRGGNTAR